MASSPVLPGNSSELTRAWRWVAALALTYALLWFSGEKADLGLSGYLPLHTTMEMASIVAAMLSFGIAWYAYAEDRAGNVVLIGTVLFGTALLDFAHVLSFQGMPVFVTASSPHKAITFWLAARYLAAFGLLIIALRDWQRPLAPKTRYWLLASVAAYVAAICRLQLFNPELVPEFFIAGQGLTPLKVFLEYILVAIDVSAALIFYHQARNGARFNAADLFAAAAIAALSELCFTLYASVSDLFNTAGHLYKIVCYGFIFRAVFVATVRQPFTALSVALDKERQLSAEQHTFVRTLNMLDEAVLEITLGGKVISANQGWWKLAGIAPDSDCRVQDCLSEEDRSAFELHLEKLASGDRREFKGRFRVLSDHHAEQWIECRFLAEVGDDGHTVSVRGVLRDITKSYQQERHITHMALHDALTGLPNRVLLEDRLHIAIQLAARSHRHVAVCFLDLDHFKDVNDAYGHKTGDALLVMLSALLKKELRECDTLARWGGDEFVMLLPELACGDDARQVAQKLLQVMRQTFELEDLAVSATFSMGIALYPDDGGNLDELLAQADRAMFYAKSQGRNNCQLFSDMSHRGLGKKDLYIQVRLAQAIREERITVWFQPQVKVSAEGVRLTGAEALARWHDEELGWISPASFIPMAENLGLIGALGSSVRRQALGHFQVWRQTRPEFQLAINVSKRQLFATDFIDTLLADVAHYEIPPSALVLEVTESVALMDVEFAEERLRQLSAAGFPLSIDDFGTGYASLSQLHELPVSELKIDISFVRRINTPEGLRMVQVIINLAQTLRLRTVAEGVEDQATATILHELGADLLQGYYFAHPCPADAFSALPLFSRPEEISLR